MNPHHLEGVGLYVHVPFCRQLCPYCDFAVAVRPDPPFEAYGDALLAELASRADELDDGVVTIYFGGGTPAMFPPAQLERVLDAVDRSQVVETTIEANPLDIGRDTLDAWASLGFDRVSLGVQSFQDRALAGIGRDHDGSTARRAVELLADDGRFRASVDLIYGGPGYDRAVLEADLVVLDATRPEHVSAYELTIEPDTVFGRRHRAGTLGVPPEDDVVDAGLELVARLADLGWDRYEVSSFARAGEVAFHNSGYWLGRPYVGIGTGAHSLSLPGVIRRANPRGLRAYLEAPTVPAEIEHVAAADHLGERLMLAARTRLGVSLEHLPLGEHEAAVRAARDELVARGWLEPGEWVRPTASGLEVADAIAQRFWDATHAEPKSG